MEDLDDLGPYSRTSYDISLASDWSRWPSRPIRSLRYIVTCTRIRALGQRLLFADQYTPYFNHVSLTCLRSGHRLRYCPNIEPL